MKARSKSCAKSSPDAWRRLPRTLHRVLQKLTNLLSVTQISPSLASQLLVSANEMKQLVLTTGGNEILKHRIMASLFFEPSTRTSCSFQAAMLRLGGQVITVNESDSSAKKGEVLEDTIATMSCYCDVIVIRHPMKGSAALAAQYTTKPVINAGDGAGEHPTQALLDLYTILSELGRIGRSSLVDGSLQSSNESMMTVTLVGDLKYGRTVHSLAKLLAMFHGIRLVYICPDSLRMPDEIIDEVNSIALKSCGEPLEQLILSSNDLAAIISETDVLYATRIQKERFPSEEEYRAVVDSYCIDCQLLKNAKPNMIVMHPLPRVNEIAREVDSDPRAAYFRQMENGMYMRMAILKHLLLGTESSSGTV